MEAKFYGVEPAAPAAVMETKTEEFKIQGYTVVGDILNEDELNYARNSLDGIYLGQESEFGRDKLEVIGELDLARCPFAEDEFFLNRLILDPAIFSFIKTQLGDYFLLHLQNGIINRPQRGHHQSSWHRDLPYQNYVVSKPIAIGVLFCIDEFSEETGGTLVLPFSHQMESMPSLVYLEKHQVQIEAKAGSVIIFNAMLLHRAGLNRSGTVRRGVNNVYSVPIIKQQIDLPRLLNGRYSDDLILRRLLGYESQSLASVSDYRFQRLGRFAL